tara:strand:+ start:265 stop:1365 length:1101 start_codon:yes stop_codon:yes gene_type:complete
MASGDLLIAGDLHVAEVWEKIKEEIPRKYNFLNPNKQLKKLISKVKKNEYLVLNGDLVDYYYSDYVPKKDRNNWALFYEIINNCKGETFLNLGNHDYRKYAWNFSIYGLEHVNISSSVRRKYGKQIGFHKFRFLGEIKCLWVNLNKFNSLKKFRHKRNYAVVIPGKDLVFLNTGPDAATRWGNYLKLNTLLPMYSDPPMTLGLNPLQLRLLKRTLKLGNRKECIVVIHAPAFFSLKKLEKVKVGWHSYSALKVKHKLNMGSFLFNGWLFLRTLIKSKRNIIVVSSHTHLPKQYILDKKTKTLWETRMSEINKYRNNSRYVKFVTTMAMGGIIEYSRKVGYLKISDEKIEHKVMKNFTHKYLLPLES